MLATTAIALALATAGPNVLEARFYARGVGVVLAVGISGDVDREELIRLRAAGRTRPG